MFPRFLQMSSSSECKRKLQFLKEKDNFQRSFYIARTVVRYEFQTSKSLDIPILEKKEEERENICINAKSTDDKFSLFISNFPSLCSLNWHKFWHHWMKEVGEKFFIKLFIEDNVWLCQNLKPMEFYENLYYGKKNFLWSSWKWKK